MKKVEEIFEKVYTYFDIKITECWVDGCGEASVQMALCDGFGVCFCQNHYNELTSLKYDRRLQTLLEQPLETIEAETSDKSYVYLIKDSLTGFIKIGLSGDPQKRLTSIVSQKTLLPYENNFSLLIAWEGTQKDETDLHRMFKNRRIRGEWFELSDVDIKTVYLWFAGRELF